MICYDNYNGGHYEEYPIDILLKMSYPECLSKKINEETC